MNRRVLVAGTVLVALLSSGGAWIALGSRARGPREQFRRDLADKVDKLVAELVHFGPGEREEEITWVGGGKAGRGTVPLPSSWSVVSLANEVREHFEYMPLPLLLEDLAGFDSWGERLRADVVQHKRRIGEQLDRIGSDFLARPKQYGGSLFGPSVGWTNAGQLYFVSGQEGCIVELILEINLDTWLDDIHQKCLDFRGPVDPAGDATVAR